MYTKITAQVYDQTLRVTNIPKLASGGENEVRVEVTFDSLWAGFGKTAVFYRKENQVYHVVMKSDTCVIPREVMAEPGVVHFGILGASGSTVRTTETVALTVAQGAITAGVSQPLPDVYKQLLAAEGRNEHDIAVERARLNNILANGGTSDDAELLDVRVDAEGTTHTTAGESVRTQYSSVKQTAERALSGYAASLGYLYDTSSLNFWEQGWISSTSGEIGNTGTDNDRYIRTVDYLPETVEFVASENGRRFHVYRYSKTGAFVDRMTATYTLTEFTPDHTAYKYKLMLTNSAGTSNIYTMTGPTSRADAAYVHFLSGHAKVATDADVMNCVNPLAYAEGYMTEHNHVGLWEQGYLYKDTGEPEYLKVNSTDYANHIRTSDFIAENVEYMRKESGWKLDVFRYTLEGVFVDAIENINSHVLDHATYKYKARLRMGANITAINRQHAVNVHFFGNSALHTNANGMPDADFGAPPRVYYQNGLSSHTAFDANTTTAEVYSKYSALVSRHRGYITTTQYGKASDGQSINVYTFAPPAVGGDHAGVEPAKIIIVGGQHGFEKANVFGMYYFFEDMCENWQNDPVLDYFRHNVKIIVVPILNPSGFDASSYKNSNGVNLNRNYPHSWTLVDDPESDQYGGAAPFDQPETQVIRRLVQANLDAAFVVDSHTKGKSSVGVYSDINWISCAKSDAPRYKKLARACRRHISTVTAHFNADYNLGLSGGTVCGYYDGFTGGASAYPTFDNWCVDQGLIAMTFEGFNGFPNEPAHTERAHKANAELIGNWLLTVCQTYGG